MSANLQLTSEPIPILFSDRGCPFAHRVQALLDHLQLAAELRQSAVGSTPEGMEQYSERTRVPLLVHGDLVLRESRVMLEYLAERYQLERAYPRNVAERALHRYAMAVADDRLAPLLLGRQQMPEDPGALDEVLDDLESATVLQPPRANLLAMHLAPLWRTFHLWHPRCVVIRAIEARPSLRRWLDSALEIDCLAKTAASIANLAEDMDRARKAGLIS